MKPHDTKFTTTPILEFRGAPLEDQWFFATQYERPLANFFVRYATIEEFNVKMQNCIIGYTNVTDRQRTTFDSITKLCRASHGNNRKTFLD